MAQCKDCIHWDECSKKDGKTRYYGKRCAANNVEILCEWFVNTADVVPKSEVEQLKRNLEQCENGYRQEMHLLQCKLADEQSKVREIFEEIEQEIELALESNYKAKNGQMMSEHITNEEREFIEYVNGKIHALGGISYFIAELKKKYTEGIDKNENET